jgi:hypothetical protein
MILLWFILPVIALSNTFYTIKTPIYKNVHCFFSHHLLLVHKHEAPLFILDFSPSERINEPSIILKLLSGNKMPGKVRVWEVPPTSMDPEIEFAYYYPELVVKLRSWDNHFQLYNHNCQTFCKFIQTKKLKE